MGGIVECISGAPDTPIPKYTVLRYELELMVRNWIHTSLNAQLTQFFERNKSQELRQQIDFASRRLSYIGSIIGHDAVQEIRAKVVHIKSLEVGDNAWHIFVNRDVAARDKMRGGTRSSRNWYPPSSTQRPDQN